eukprot:11129383-Karenia_brevis.AAC.1
MKVMRDEVDNLKKDAKHTNVAETDQVQPVQTWIRALATFQRLLESRLFSKGSDARQDFGSLAYSDLF